MMKIELSGPKGKGKFALVDDDDFEMLKELKWNLSNGYAVCTARKPTIRMHRMIMGITDSKVCCDHINGNCLDNRKENLRIATTTQNNWNARKKKGAKSSKYKGVSFSKSNQKFSARIRIGTNKRINIGFYDTEKEAAVAYNIEARKYHGEFAKLNDVEEDIEPVPAKRGASKYYGVYFHKKNQKWVARLHLEGKSIFLGQFRTEIEAAKRYNEEAEKIGKKLNIIKENY